MTDLPEPLSPADCDLRDYPWMPLDCRRLLTSETWVLGTAEQKVAALTLWCESWSQVPAGSMSADERMLAHLSGAGANWKRVREHVLRGWVLCGDGRLYHPVVAEKACEAWKLKLAQRARTEAARAARDANRKKQTDSTPPSATDTATRPVTESAALSVTETVTASTRQDQTIQERKKETPLPSVGPPRTATRGSRLPSDWSPTPESRRYAAEQGLNPDAVAANFRDYWCAKAGKDAVKTDWPATWRMWCRRDAERQASAPKPKRVGLEAAYEAAGLFAEPPSPDPWIEGEIVH